MDKKIHNCPVCAEPLQNGVRCACGYDLSMDYERFLCLRRVPESAAGVKSIRFRHRSYIEERNSELCNLRSQVRQLTQRNAVLEKEFSEMKKRCDGLVAANQKAEQYHIYFDEVKRYLDDVIQERDQARTELLRQREHAVSRETALRQALSQAYFERDQLRKLLEEEMRRRS